jgi:hypothetical protein
MRAKTIELLRHPKNFKILLEMFAFAAATPLLLRVYSLDRFLGLITPSPKCHDGSISQLAVDRIIGLGVLLLKRNRLFLRNTCLKRSLLLYYFLRKNGIEVKIHFGVQKRAGYLAGHSWLTRNGNLLADEGRFGEAFTPIASYPKHVETIQI